MQLLILVLHFPLLLNINWVVGLDIPDGLNGFIVVERMVCVSYQLSQRAQTVLMGVTLFLHHVMEVEAY
jgi:hypothetical protein